jgi:hypothetical protein
MPRSYDVLVSHAAAGRSWVEGFLFPAFDEAGVRYQHELNFRSGVPHLVEFERGVRESERILLVLSPAYLDSNFTELESVLSEHLGLERSERRLLMVMREPCKPHLRMRARLWLDMTDDAETETNLERLASELRRPPDA